MVLGNIRDVFHEAYELVRMRLGTITLTLQPLTEEALESINKALADGTFVQFMNSLLKEDSFLEQIKGQTVKVTVVINIPLSHLPYLTIEEAKLAVQELIKFDDREQETKRESASEVRHVSHEIKEEEERQRGTRNAAAAVAAIGTAAAFFTFGASLLVTAAAVAVAAAAMLSFLTDSTAQKRAQTSINCYAKILKDYKAALKETSTLQEKSNSEVLKSLDAVRNRKRKHLLNKFLEDARSVRVNEEFRVKYGEYDVKFDELTLMFFFKKLIEIWKKDTEYVCTGLKSIADQIEQYEILEEVK